jgi:hypothetical protein
MLTWSWLRFAPLAQSNCVRTPLGSLATLTISSWNQVVEFLREVDLLQKAEWRAAA